MTTPAPTPGQAWARLAAGNERFATGRMEHPSQDVDRRHRITAAQHPYAVVFGCSDSRVAAELIFDQGLGDVFVVRTAGHVVDTTVIGSIEYGVAVAGASLVVVLGHDHCGAVDAAIAALRHGVAPPGFVRAIVDRVIPSIVGLDVAETTDPNVLGTWHVRHTVQMLTAYSLTLAQAVHDGRCAIIGAEYALSDDGRVRVVETVGTL